MLRARPCCTLQLVTLQLELLERVQLVQPCSAPQLTWAGAFNQVMELREQLALAFILNRTVILPPLFSCHNVDSGERFANIPLDYFDLLSPELRPHVALADEVRAQGGWDSSFSKVICIGGLTRAEALAYYTWHGQAGLRFPEYDPADKADIIWDGLGTCDNSGNLQQLRHMIEGQRFVSLFTFVMGNTFFRPRRPQGAPSACRCVGWEGWTLLQMAVARGQCAGKWLNAQPVVQNCYEELSPDRVAAVARQAAVRYNTTTVFVMAMAKLYPLVKARFDAEAPDLTLRVLSPDQVQGAYEQAPDAKTLAALVLEVQLCTDAAVFLGEPLSSIFEFIQETRSVLGKGDSFYYGAFSKD